MDVAQYWEQTKKYSKELTGVEKLSPGFINKKTGIPGPLEAYVEAYKNGNRGEFMKQAAKAVKAIEKYLNTILDKEMENAKKKKNKGKGTLQEADLKSAKNIRSGLGNILVQLKKVLQDKTPAGSFDRDAEDDLKKVNLDPKLVARMKERMKLHAKNLKEAKTLTHMYKQELKKATDLVTKLQVAVKQAAASHKINDANVNREAQRVVSTLVGAGESHRAKLDAHYKKNYTDNKNFLEARNEIESVKNLPQSLHKPYRQAYDAYDREARVADDFYQKTVTVLSKVNGLEDAADSVSLVPADQAKIHKKVKKMLTEMKAAKRIKDDSHKTDKAVLTFATILGDKMGVEQKSEIYDSYKKRMLTTIQRNERNIEIVERVGKWLEAPGESIQDPAVFKDASTLADEYQAAEPFVGPCKKANAKVLQAIKGCDAKIKSLQAAV